MAKMGKPRLDVNTVTPATKEMKKLLSAIDSMSEQRAVAGFSNIAKSCCKEDKALLHLQLFFHLPYPEELEPVLEDPGDFVFLVPGYCSNSRVSPKVFCDVVVEGELLTHFLQLVHHLQDKPFVQELTGNVLTKFASTENYNDLFPNVLFMLGKISRRETGGDFFLKQFSLTLSEFLKHSLMLKYDKLCTLFRLAGVVCMKSEDYAAGGSDLLELLEEWNFDLTNRIARETKIYLSDFFQDAGGQSAENNERLRVEVLSAIEDAIIGLQVTSEEEKEWGGIRKTHRIHWTEFIGVHAFLTQSILEKYSASGELDCGVISDLMNTVTKWAAYRPKLTRTDFHGEIGHFDQFYKILKRFGEKERDRAELLPKFMEFSYKEVYCSKDGLRIAEKYLIPSGDLDTVSAYILTALKRENMPDECRGGGGGVPPMVKLMIQKLLCSNPEMKMGKMEMIPKIFKDGAHSDLILSDFSYHLNNLCSKIGTIEKEEKDAAQIEHNRDLVYSTCLEDPAHAVLTLMQHSIASHMFKALTFAKPFLMIPVSSSQLSKRHPLQTTVGNSSFEKILDNAEEHDAILGEVALSVPYLISKELITPQVLLHILKRKISSGMKKPNLKKMSKLYQILNAFANALITEAGRLKDDQTYAHIFQEILTFTLDSKKLTYCAMPKTSGKDLFYIRFLCSATVEAIIRSGVVAHDPLSETALQNQNLLSSSATMIQIGNIYVRLPHLRETISHLIQNPSDFFQLESEFEFSSLQNTLITLVQHSDTEEWPIILEFVIEVLGKCSSFPHDLGTLVNRSLRLAWNNFIAVSAQPALRQYLKFYDKAVQSLVKKGLATISNQKSCIDSIVILAIEMRESLRRRKSPGDKTAIGTSIQQVLLLALEVLHTIILHNPEQFGKELQEDVLDSFGLLPVIHGGCEPIRKCLLDTALNFQNPKFISLNSGSETVEKMRNVADISNLRGLVREGKTFVME